MILAIMFSISMVWLAERLLAAAFVALHSVSLKLIALATKVNALSNTRPIVFISVPIGIISLSFIRFKHASYLIEKAFTFLVSFTHTEILNTLPTRYNYLIYRTALCTLIYMHLGWSEYYPPEEYYVQD